MFNTSLSQWTHPKAYGIVKVSCLTSSHQRRAHHIDRLRVWSTLDGSRVSIAAVKTDEACVGWLMQRIGAQVESCMKYEGSRWLRVSSKASCRLRDLAMITAEAVWLETCR